MPVQFLLHPQQQRDRRQAQLIEKWGVCFFVPGEVPQAELPVSLLWLQRIS